MHVRLLAEAGEQIARRVQLGRVGGWEWRHENQRGGVDVGVANEKQRMVTLGVGTDNEMQWMG